MFTRKLESIAIQELSNWQLNSIIGGQASQSSTTETEDKPKGKKIPAGTGLRHYL